MLVMNFASAAVHGSRALSARARATPAGTAVALPPVALAPVALPLGPGVVLAPLRAPPHAVVAPSARAQASIVAPVACDRVILLTVSRKARVPKAGQSLPQDILVYAAAANQPRPVPPRTTLPPCPA